MGKRKYAKIGEEIEIIEPVRFVRCGYPLSMASIMRDRRSEVEKKLIRILAVLEDQPEPEFKEPDAPVAVLALPDDGFLSPSYDTSISWIGIGDTYTSNLIQKAICAFILRKEQFGGQERRIFEERLDGYSIPGRGWHVTNKRFVRTGTYSPGYQGYSCYSGEYDYDPPELYDSETHCVYTVVRGNCVWLPDQHCSPSSMDILAVHTRRIEDNKQPSHPEPYQGDNYVSGPQHS